MITGVHTMFTSSEPEALRALLVTRFQAPGGFEIQLYQPRYSRNPVPR